MLSMCAIHPLTVEEGHGKRAGKLRCAQLSGAREYKIERMPRKYAGNSQFDGSKLLEQIKILVN